MFQTIKKSIFNFISTVLAGIIVLAMVVFLLVFFVFKHVFEMMIWMLNKVLKLSDN